VTFLLDTNLISELRKGTNANQGVRRWRASTGDHQTFLSVLVRGEIRHGIERLRRRGDIPQASMIETWLDDLDVRYEDRILPITEEIADTWGRLNAASPLPIIDGLLAATAIVHEMTFVTRNRADVARTGVAVLNPFEE